MNFPCFTLPPLGGGGAQRRMRADAKHRSFFPRALNQRPRAPRPALIRPSGTFSQGEKGEIGVFP